MNLNDYGKADSRRALFTAQFRRTVGIPSIFNHAAYSCILLAGTTILGEGRRRVSKHTRAQRAPGGLVAGSSALMLEDMLGRGVSA